VFKVGNTIIVGLGDLYDAAIKMEKDPVDGLQGNQKVIRTACENVLNCPSEEMFSFLICVVDSTNSTGLSRQRRGKKTHVGFGIVDIAKYCLDSDFIKIAKSGDAVQVENFIVGFKKKYKINLFSFFSKLFCYFDLFALKADNYSIYDSIVSDNLYSYDLRKKPIGPNSCKYMRAKCLYKKYNDIVATILDSQSIYELNDDHRRRHLDNYIW